MEKTNVVSERRRFASGGNVGFTSRFLRDANPLLACQKTLRTRGLSRDSHEECKRLLEAIPPRSSVRKGFEN